MDEFHARIHVSPHLNVRDLVREMKIKSPEISGLRRLLYNKPILWSLNAVKTYESSVKLVEFVQERCARRKFQGFFFSHRHLLLNQQPFFWLENVAILSPLHLHFPQLFNINHFFVYKDAFFTCLWREYSSGRRAHLTKYLSDKNNMLI